MKRKLLVSVATATLCAASAAYGQAYGQGQTYRQQQDTQQQNTQRWQGGQGGQSEGERFTDQSSDYQYRQQQQQTGRQMRRQQVDNRQRQGQRQFLFRASELIGTDISSSRGQNLGQLKEIVFHPQTGIYAVVSLRNGRLVPIPWQKVDAVTQDGLVFNITLQTLNSAPAITGGQWTSFNSPRFTQRIDSHFRVQTSGQMGGMMSGMMSDRDTWGMGRGQAAGQAGQGAGQQQFGVQGYEQQDYDRDSYTIYDEQRYDQQQFDRDFDQQDQQQFDHQDFEGQQFETQQRFETQQQYQPSRQQRYRQGQQSDTTQGQYSGRQFGEDQTTHYGELEIYAEGEYRQNQQSQRTGNIQRVRGRLTDIDQQNNRVVVQTEQGQRMTFWLSDDATVRVGGQSNASLNDLNQGQNVQISYRDQGGSRTVQSIQATDQGQGGSYQFESGSQSQNRFDDNQ